MLRLAVVSTDLKSSDLQTALERTMPIHSVEQWTPSPKLHPVPGGSIPDVVLLDMSHNTQASLEFANHVHRLHPALPIVACSQFQPSPDVLLCAMRAGVQDFLPKPLDFVALKATLLRLNPEGESAKGSRQPGKLIVVMGTKGGVGTSTVAVNLAVQLKQTAEKNVVLLDFARPLGDDCLLLDLQPRFSIRDAIENADRMDAHFLAGLLTHHKSGLEVMAGALSPDDWQNATMPALARVIAVAQSHYDFVIVDFGSFYSSEWKPVLAEAEILLVAEPNLPGLYQLQRYVRNVFSGIDEDRVRLVINRWHRRDEEALKSVEKHLKRPIFARLPNDFHQVTVAASLGVPLSQNHGYALPAKLRELASRLAEPTPEVEEHHNSIATFPLRSCIPHVSATPILRFN